MRTLVFALLVSSVTAASLPAIAAPAPASSLSDSIRYLIVAREAQPALHSAKRLLAAVEIDPEATPALRLEALMLWTETCIWMRPRLEAERVAGLQRLREHAANLELDSRERAGILRLQALDEARTGRWSSAVRVLASAESTLASGGDRDGLDRGRVLMQKARSLRALGRHVEAVVALKHAAAIFESTQGPDSPQLWDCLGALSATLVDCGRTAEGLVLQARALQRIREVFGDRSVRLAFALYDATGTEMELGRFDRAFEYAREALSIAQQRHGESPPRLLPDAINAFGNALDHLDRNTEADSLYVASIAAASASGLDSAAVLYSLGSRLRLLNEMRRFEEADNLARELRPRAMFLVGSQVRVTWQITLEAIAAALGVGDLQRARSLLVECEAPGMLREQWLVVAHHWLRGWTSWLEGDAVAAFEDAEANLRSLREDILTQAMTMTEQDALSLRRDRLDGVDLLLLALKGAPPDSARTRRAFNAIVRSRSLVFDAVVAGRARRDSLEFGVDAALLDSLVAVRARASARSLAGGSLDGRPRIAEEREATYDLLTRLGVTEPGSAWLVGELDRATGDVTASLGPGEVLVSFVRHAHRLEPLGSGQDRSASVPWYSAFVVEGAGQVVRFIDLGPAAHVDSLVVLWRESVMAGLAGGTTTERAERLDRIAKAGQRLRSTILDGVVPSWQSIESIHVVPDGNLTLIPFDLLPAVDGTLLVEGGAHLRTWSTERDLIPTPRQPGGRSGVLILGDPDFESRQLAANPFAPASEDAPSTALAHSEPDTPVYRAFDTGACEALASRNFAPLHQSLQEAKDVAGVAASVGIPVGLLLGPKASEGSLSRWARGCELLHVATHGFFVSRPCGSLPPGPESALLRSGIVLAGANTSSGSADDGLLTAEEIGELDLRGTRCVVLSACESGLGVSEAGEGLLGLRRALRLAGAESVVASLWPVGDQMARRWMWHFYREYFRGSRDAAAAGRAATRESLKTLRATGREPDPLALGAFVVTSRRVRE